jgi:DNA-binding transcriptional LysR family regulator
MDRLENLALFVRIVEKRGVAAAGRDFGLSPATASERLAALEAYYGASLLHRTTRSISLTDAGKTVVERARILLAEADDLEARVKLGIDQLSGNIRISAPHDLGERRIAPLLDDFMDINAGISVELLLADGYVDIVGQGFDLAVRFGALRDSNLIARKLGPNRRVICASPAYLEARGVPRQPEELVDHNCLVMQFGQIVDREWSFLINNQHCKVSVSGNRIANSGIRVREWCLAGHGIALKSVWDVHEDLKSGRLVELLDAFSPDAQSSLQFLFPKSSRLVRRVRSLMDFLDARMVKPDVT